MRLFFRSLLLTGATLALFSQVRLFAAVDAAVELGSTNGSTELSFLNGNGMDVGGIDSLGRADFSTVTIAGVTLIDSSSTLQTGATFYVNTGTVAGPMYADANARVGGVFARDYTTATASGTAAQTNMMSVTIPGGIMGTNRTVRLRMAGDIFNHSGAARNISFRASFGGSQILVSTASVGICANNNIAYDLTLYLTNVNSASSQKAYYHMTTHCVSVNIPASWTSSGVASVNTASNQTLAVNVALGTAIATFWTRKEIGFAVLE